ncbi:hypothetical protein P8A21_38425 [Streptomyces poriferorum]|nr:hypothetical protein [Streptomyces sp. Alt1]WLQ53014.1 hypothetical protein P8A21_38425 [Streptomyces sp. Alt1]
MKITVRSAAENDLPALPAPCFPRPHPTTWGGAAKFGCARHPASAY